MLEQVSNSGLIHLLGSMECENGRLGCSRRKVQIALQMLKKRVIDTDRKVVNKRLKIHQISSIRC